MASDPRALAAALQSGGDQSPIPEEVSEPQGGDPVIAALADMVGVPPEALIMSLQNAMGHSEMAEGQKI